MNTQGPWSLTGETDGWMASHDGIGSSEYRAVKDADGAVVALVVAQSEEHWADLDTETPGRLIAAAPELLVAAKTAVTNLAEVVIEMAVGRAATPAEVSRLIEVSTPDSPLGILRAAIAKATGA